MNTDLNANPELIEGLPNSQPYNVSPWNYTGSESVAAIPNTDVVDWVLIELHDATDASSVSSSTIMGRYASFLKKDGSIVDLDGNSNQLFSNSATQQLFVVLKHRNHLGILSASSLNEFGGIYYYDFTTPSGQAYGTDAQKSLGGGVYGLYGGDGNADGDVNTDDKSIWTIQAGTQGYKSADFDMNGQVSNSDKNDKWIINTGKSLQIPD